MRAAIYNPYLDTLGGGERYSIAFAKALEQLGYDVFVEWKNTDIKDKLEKRFGVDLKNINFVKDVKKGEKYDLVFWVSDGSIPLLHSRKNYLHFQIPFTGVDGKSLFNKMKLFRVNKIICNSCYTKKFIDREYGVNSEVLYPPVDTKNIFPKRKQNIILFVGRFSQLTQAKNQHILISTFKRMVDNGLNGWKLVLAGGVEIGADKYLTKLYDISEGYPVEIIESPSFDEIKSMYGVAKIFWSAVGYGFEEESEAKKFEHFGITVVEAMSAGCVPVVYAGGGHKETVNNGKNGFLWSKKSHLVKLTSDLISDQAKLRVLSDNCHNSVNNYSYEQFFKKVKSVIA